MGGGKKWSDSDDHKLLSYICMHGPRNWNAMASELGIGRTGSACRHRWNNELSLKGRLGDFTCEEMLRVLELHLECGDRWVTIAGELQGRTDNEVKNFWKSQLTRKAVELGHMVESREFLQLMRATVQAAARGGGGGSATTAVGPSSTTADVAASSDFEARRLREIEAYLMSDD